MVAPSNGSCEVAVGEGVLVSHRCRIPAQEYLHSFEVRFCGILRLYPACDDGNLYFT